VEKENGTFAGGRNPAGLQEVQPFLETDLVALFAVEQLVGVEKGKFGLLPNQSPDLVTLSVVETS
jgi:hypothetical protein